MNNVNLMDLLANPADTRNQINQFSRDNLQGINPEQKVRELVESGQMSQVQYNMLSKMATALMKIM